MTQFSDLPWEKKFTENHPGDAETRNFTRPVSNVLYSPVHPTRVSAPKLIGWSTALARELGIERPASETSIAHPIVEFRSPTHSNTQTASPNLSLQHSDTTSLALLSGNLVLPTMNPYASRYGGHQFGHWAGQLGDGRAITLGEAQTKTGRQEFQLKGAGPTPYSRRADGRAVLRSTVREFLCSEAMHFLGVPTTRALSLVLTGDAVTRDMFYNGNPQDEPGAIVCRVAPSFLRFGNFEILAASEEPELLKKLADTLITEHYPELNFHSTANSQTSDGVFTDPDVYGKLLDTISSRTALMVAEWMRVGFVHGVMNTDNMSALGLTIDYGPYGWLEAYDPGWTPNTTDSERRRYRYGSQPGVAHWNLGRLCEAFASLVPDEKRLHASLKIFEEAFVSTYGRILADKLGVREIGNDEDEKLVTDLFTTLQSVETDMTIFFRNISKLAAENTTVSDFSLHFWKAIEPAFYSPDTVPATVKAGWLTWSERYLQKIRRDEVKDAERLARMKLANPKYVLRNYLAQNVITAAENGDYAPLERLLRVLEKPYDDQPGEEDLAEKRPEWARNAPGCSALSCSS